MTTADQQLFVDWCAATDFASEPVGRAVLDAFFNAVPCAPSLRQRRARGILRMLTADLIQLDFPRPAPSATTIRSGAGWVGVSRALDQLPTLRYPVGLRGRRDGWLLVLIGVLGLTRCQALAATADDVVLFPELTIAGRPVSKARDAATCPACAVYRWLSVLGPAAIGFRQEVGDLLSPVGADLQVHDCVSGLVGQWRSAPTLAPAIDRYGWLSGAPISTVALSAVMTFRQRPAGAPEGATVAASFEATGRFKDASSRELADAFDEVDARLSALLARTVDLAREFS